ncbi:MAG TPA: HNH endonuclease signature motif containing protein [Anaeromyxobacteraceae bacterium]
MQCAAGARRGSLHLARPDGQRCGSTWKLELDHLRPVVLGGPSTVENLRILCKAHNTLSAEQIFGRAHMELFRAASASRTGEDTSPGGSESRGARRANPLVRRRR